jgi:hypothetical protein
MFMEPGTDGILSLASMLSFWGWVFLGTTLYVRSQSFAVRVLTEQFTGVVFQARSPR